MTDRLALDLASIPPTYKGNYLIHLLHVPAADFDPVTAERALAQHGRELLDLPADEIDRQRAAAEHDVLPWARQRKYHVANCPGCIGGRRVGRVPKD